MTDIKKAVGVGLVLVALHWAFRKKGFTIAPGHGDDPPYT